jgi:hypothetical protein
VIRETVVRLVKPRLPEELWRAVRRLDPTSASRDDERASRAADLSRRDLTELAQLFETDKWGSRHRYTPHYETHLRFLKQRQFALLEIGIGGYSRERQGGASLRMWKAFFPRAQVVGLDIEDKSFVDEDRIRTYRGSQTDTDLLDTILAEHAVRVVVDDGSHRSEHILDTFAHVFPRLPAGAIYAIEDTETSYWSDYGGSTDPAAPTTMNLVKGLLDSLNYEEFTPRGHTPSAIERGVTAVHAYHNLVFIEKGHNAERGGTRHPSAVRAAEQKASAAQAGRA